MAYIDENGLAEFTAKIKAYLDSKLQPTPPEPEEEYFLTFSSPNSFTLNVVDNQKYWDGTLETSTDKTNWNEWNGTSAVSSSNDGKLYLRGTSNTLITGQNASASTKAWILTGSNISCSGNIENLLDYATVQNGNHPPMAERCFYALFINNTALISAPDMLATTLTRECYRIMYQGCSNLVTAPEELPALADAGASYYQMFKDCSSLVRPPKIMLTSFYSSLGCLGMFENCVELIALPKLYSLELKASKVFTTITGDYVKMFNGCSKIKLSETPSAEYINEYRIPYTGTGTVNATGGADPLSNMFTGTGGTLTGTPIINTTYYTSNEVI